MNQPNPYNLIGALFLFLIIFVYLFGWTGIITLMVVNYFLNK